MVMIWIIIVIMVLHGLIHLMGGLDELGLAEIQELSGETLIPLPGYMHSFMGVLWFIATILFILSAVALAARRYWWKRITAIAVILSQVLIILWWPDAKAGTVANALLILALVIRLPRR